MLVYVAVRLQSTFCVHIFNTNFRLPFGVSTSVGLDFGCPFIYNVPGVTGLAKARAKSLTDTWPAASKPVPVQ